MDHNKQKFLETQNFEIGLIDCRKLVISILGVSFKKLPTKVITYRDQKYFNQVQFHCCFDSRLLKGELYKNCEEPF